MWKFSVLDEMKQMLMPRFCTVCGATVYDQSIFCTRCQYEMPRTRYHSDYDNKTSNVFAGRIPFQRATSYFYYSKHSFFTRPIFQLKYHGKKHIGKELGLMFGAELMSNGFMDGIDCIVPVPIHPDKARKRGYNQCQLIAEGISEMTGVSVNNSSLIRSEYQKSQTTKGRDERYDNLKNAFQLEKPELLHGKHALLIDDVITTGATIEASALAMLESIDVQLSIASIALALN